MEIKERNREIVNLNIVDNDIDFTDSKWDYAGETYVAVQNKLSDGDGEWHRVILQRSFDKKYFEFFWGKTPMGSFSIENQLKEVFPKRIVTTIYE